MKLCDAAVGKTMVVTNVHMCKKEKDRLFYLGIYPGMQIRKLRSAPMQDPCLYFA
ncbi:MAG TPA: DNA-binding protein, partial [Erysipelotrichaceae bacterium]|nr:DNA-binding protein [Erysipelotrichaceae bacterium]